MNVAERLRAVRVLDPEGAPHRLADEWRDRAAVLVFIRHFG
jgi:hypothetical protein